MVQSLMPDASSTVETPPLIPRLLLFGLIGIAGLILLVLLLIGYVNWQGGRAWENFRAEWEAKGERFELADFVPKPVPPEQNFATTPLLVPLLDFTRVPGNPVRWNDPKGKERADALANLGQILGRKRLPSAGQWQTGSFIDLTEWQALLATNSASALSPPEAACDVLAALRKFDADIDELTTASLRPHSVFPIRYEDNVSALLPHLSTLKGISKTVRLRALARLAAGQKAEGLQDVKLGLRLVDALKTEPLLISQLVRIANVQIAIQPVWEGLARHDWTEAQLAELQAALAKVRVLEDYGRTLRGERALGNAALDELRTGRLPFSALGRSMDNGSKVANSAARFIPSGWFRQNQVTLNRLYQERCLPLVDAAKHRVYAGQTQEADNAPELQKAGLYNLFARLLFPAVSKSAAKFAHAQATLDLATVACALERHRLANGQYPDQLDLLVPRFVEKIPNDVISGEPLKYRRESDGTFTLYSVGWNESDDGGEVFAGKAGAAPDPNQGDWVWSYTAK